MKDQFGVLFKYQRCENDFGIKSSPVYFATYDEAMRHVKIQRDLSVNKFTQYALIETPWSQIICLPFLL